MPRPPVKRNGRRGGSGGGGSGGSAAEGSYTGVERKTNHSALKVPMWNVRKNCATKTRMTLRVKI